MSHWPSSVKIMQALVQPIGKEGQTSSGRILYDLIIYRLSLYLGTQRIPKTMSIEYFSIRGRHISSRTMALTTCLSTVSGTNAKVSTESQIMGHA